MGRSKENQTGEQPRDVAVPFGHHPETCPVRAVEAWLFLAGITRGPLFRNIRRGDHLGAQRLSDEDVARRVKVMVGSIGKEPSAYAGHSLRAGFVTAAARAGASDHDIMTHTRHLDIATMRRYIRAATLFDTTPARKIDL